LQKHYFMTHKFRVSDNIININNYNTEQPCIYRIFIGKYFFITKTKPNNLVKSANGILYNVFRKSMNDNLTILKDYIPILNIVKKYPQINSVVLDVLTCCPTSKIISEEKKYIKKFQKDELCLNGNINPYIPIWVTRETKRTICENNGCIKSGSVSIDNNNTKIKFNFCPNCGTRLINK